MTMSPSLSRSSEGTCEFGEHRVVADVQRGEFQSLGEGSRGDQVVAEADAGMIGNDGVAGALGVGPTCKNLRLKV